MTPEQAEKLEIFLRWAIHSLPYILEQNKIEQFEESMKTEGAISQELKELIDDKCGLGLSYCIAQFIKDIETAIQNGEDINQFTYTAQLLHTALKCC
ncbi:MAG: hypothetical protein AB7E76_06805 [Deferribacterales bacterium]